MYEPKDRDANQMIGYDLKHNPELYQYTRKALRSAARGSRPELSEKCEVENMYKTTHHWNTSYRQQAKSLNRGNQAERPFWSYNKAAYRSGRGSFKTEYAGSMGTYGSNPIKTRAEQHVNGKFDVEVNDMK